MQTWYYSKNGEQRGPVSLDELRGLVSRGELNGASDLAWTEGMPTWQPTGQISALVGGGTPDGATSAPAAAFNPYASPTTAPDNLLAPLPEGDLVEVVPGSVQLDMMACIKRGIELTKRHFGTILPIGIVYMVILMVVGGVEGFISGMLTGSSFEDGSSGFSPVLIPIKVASALFSVFLASGLTRAALNICDGKKATVNDLFSQGGKMVPLIGAYLLFYIMFVAGLFLLVLPGLFVALRFGYFINAIVDRNLRPVEALKYSYSITTNNTVSVFGLGLLMGLIVLAGVLALLVGLVFAIPVVTLAFVLGYRFLQYGPGALQDRSGTKDLV